MSGTAWMCDGKGRILEVLRDELNLCHGIDKGMPFAKVLAASSEAKATEFIEALLREDAVFDWQMDVIFADRKTPMHFAGGVTDDYLLIMASLSEPGIKALNKELLLNGSAPSIPTQGVEAGLAKTRDELRTLVEELEAIDHQDAKPCAARASRLITYLDGLLSSE